MLQLVLSSFSNPRDTAPKILGWSLQLNELVLVACLVAVLSGLLDALTRMFLPLPAELESAAISPVPLAVVQLASIFVISALMYHIGRIFGGRGDYLGALKATIWISILGLFFTVITLFLMSMSPAFAMLFQLVTIFWMLGIFTIFVQALHGFDNFFTTLAAVLGTMFVFATILVVVLSSLGLMPQTA